MSETIHSNAAALIEDVVRTFHPKAQERARQLFRDVFLANLTALSPGGNLLQIGGPKAGSSAPPLGVTHTVTGANGVATVAISNPPSALPGSIWHRIRYSPNVSFIGKNVTTLPATQATSITIPQSGVSAFYQLQSSHDKVTWSPWQFPASGPKTINAGLVGSQAMEPGTSFNQTNYADVTATVSGGTATVNIQGTGGRFTPYTAIKGGVESSRPSATIVGLALGADQFVGWDGAQYQLKPTLADVLSDDLEPVGAVIDGTPGGGSSKGGNGGRLSAIL